MSWYSRASNYPFYSQHDSMDCGPACLRMIAAYYGKKMSLQILRDKCYIGKAGVSLKGIAHAAEEIGFRTLAVKIPFEAPINEPSLLVAPLPAILHWNQQHFVVLYKLTKKYAMIGDPAASLIKVPIKNFLSSWISSDNHGVCLLFETSPSFFNDYLIDEVEVWKFWNYFVNYIRPYRALFFQLLMGIFVSLLFSVLFPFLTQSIVDIGINTQDLHFIYIILLGQLMLFFGQNGISLLQNWIYLQVSQRISVNLTSDFLIKLMNLPISFFDTKFIGDLMQRVGDQKRIENFLTQTSLQLVLAILNIIVFGTILAWYSIYIFLIFLVSSIIYISWLVVFLKRRKEIDYLAFQRLSENQNSLIEIIQGITEIKLHGSQLKRRWSWTILQAKLFRIQIKSLFLSQFQETGGQIIHQLKDILIIALAASLVIDHKISLGMMLAIQFIIGRLNAPITQLMNYLRSAQDASISMERLNEVKFYPNEEVEGSINYGYIPDSGNIELERVSFKYNPLSDFVLEDVSIQIPRGKITAIIGASGSGKTTLLKLLLQFYKPSSGIIKIGTIPIDYIKLDILRASLGAVMQDSFIFSDTILNNISESSDSPNIQNYSKAIHIANIKEFIDSLPLGANTMIGANGNGISQGQRQRLLIARAVYKNPEFILFDEATNSLDAENEKIIMENLSDYFVGKTVIIVAHRLSTVINADKIIVLERGKVIEEGNHKSLSDKRGLYFNLVRNQLDIGN